MTDGRFSAAEDTNSEDAPSCGYGELLAAFAMAAVVAVVALAFTLRYHSGSSAPQLSGPPPGSSDFCCSERVEDFARYINTSLDPCKNFFEYTCSNMYRFNLSANTSRRDALVEFVSTGIYPTAEKRRGPVGYFLHAYFQSCVRSIDDHGSLVSQIAFHLARLTHDTLVRPGARSSLEFIITAALKYKLPSLLLVDGDHEPSKLFLRFGARCEVEPFNAAMNASVSALRGAFNGHLTVEETSKFMKELCRRFPLPATTKTRTYYFGVDNAAIDRELWHVRDIEAALSAIGLTMDKARVIEVIGQPQIQVIRDAFASNADCGVKAAYLLWHSVIAATDLLVSNGSRLYLNGFERCMDRSVSIGDLLQRLAEEAFSSPERDAAVTSIFDYVKKAVLHDVSILLDLADVARFTKLLSDISVTTAAADATTRPAVDVPTASNDFSENFLLAQEYSYAVSQSRTRRLNRDSLFYPGLSTGDVTATNWGQLEVSLELYFTAQQTSAKSDLLSMPVLSYELARFIWSGVLRNKQWNAKTKGKLEHFKECFRKNIMKSNISRDDQDEIISASLALESLLRAFSRPPDWYTSKLAWSMWAMSHAQFFHISVGLQRCRTVSPHVERAWQVAIPFMYVEDFYEAFNCSKDSKMAMLRAECRIGS